MPSTSTTSIRRARTGPQPSPLWPRGTFRSLTYRDMPIALAPNLWRRLGGGNRRSQGPREWVHVDRPLVDADSPEGLEEVFWRIFDGQCYVAADHLAPHRPDAETLLRYQACIGAMLAADEGRKRHYLSKNNNAILRLDSVRQALPEAVILIPVRLPTAHAAALLRQHRNFLKQQDEDGFVRCLQERALDRTLRPRDPGRAGTLGT
ncbi:hypothetical protein [Rhodobacter sp. NSM]|uniref:hypothetical protein n=1 Tax=Rhodobacter sp. NSM TaxID=3457501 RepID=UPI003FD0745C